MSDCQNASFPSTALRSAGKQYTAGLLPLAGRITFNIPASVIAFNARLIVCLFISDLSENVELEKIG